MKIFSNKIIETKYTHILDLEPLKDKKSLYVDIETTGFSRKNDMIYLIGLLYYIDDDLVVEQYLCEKLADEYELLYKFNQLVTGFDEVIHFNGDNFDLPFIIERMHLYRIKENLSELKSLDFLKLLRPFKKVIGTDNLKLKTMEKIAGYRRIDAFSGGELIQLFKLYLDGDKKLETSFILHNEEDMIGLYYLNVFRPLISLTKLQITDEAYHMSSNNNNQSIQVNINLELPKEYYPLDLKRDDYQISFKNNQLEITLPLINGEFKTFFENYKDYYYLPKEDYAIHESLASFVQSKFRRKANKHTAYTKKEDVFVKCPITNAKLTSLIKNFDNVYIFNESINDSFALIRLEDLDLILPNIINSLVHNIIT